MDELFSFSDPIEFLSACFQKRRSLNPRYSLRAWSRQLGYNTPSYLAQVMKGERTLKPELAEKMSSHLRLSKKQKRYFDLLVILKNERVASQRAFLQKLLMKTAKEKDFSWQQIDAFHAMSKWYHVAILEMVELKDFDPTPSAICKR